MQPYSSIFKLIIMSHITKLISSNITDFGYDLAIVTDAENRLVNDGTSKLADEMLNSLASIPRCNVQYFSDFDWFVNETSIDCPFLFVVAIVSCKQNLLLYEHQRRHCYSSVLISIYEFACQRPPKDIGFGIPNLKSLKDLFPLLVDIKHSLDHRWKELVVLHERDLDVTQFEHFARTDKLEDNPSVLEFRLQYELPNSRVMSSYNYKLMQDFRNDQTAKVFIVVGDMVLLEKMLDVAKKLSLINLDNKWIFILTENFEAELLSKETEDIISESDVLLVHNTDSARCFELRSSCLNELLVQVIGSAIQAISNPSIEQDLFTNKRRTRLQAKNRLLSEIKLLFSSKNVTQSNCGNCDHYQIWSLYKHRTNDIIDPISSIVQVNHKIKFQIFKENHGTWSPFKGLVVKEEMSSEINLKNRPLNIGIVNQPPLIRVFRDNANSNTPLKIVGVNYEMILVLAAKLNFTPNFVIPNNIDNFGYMTPNGTWSGVIRRVIDGEADIGANGYWKTVNRLNMVDFSSPFSLEEITMLTKKTDEDHKYLFLAPFTWDAWLCILVTVTLMGPFLWFVHNHSKYYQYYQLDNGNGLFKLGNCIWYCFGAIVQQGGDYLPLAVSGRLLITFWWLFVIVTITTYSGNLVALLTFPKIFNPINDITDLLKYKHVLKYGTTQNSGIEELVRNSEDYQLNQLAENIVYYENTEIKTVLELVKQMKVVFLETKTTLKHMISEDFKQYNVCRLMIAKESIITKPISLIVNKKRSKKFKDKINYEVSRMAKSGLVALWIRKHEAPGNDCLYPLIVRAGDVKKIGLSHMVDCFFVLGFGLAIGIISLMIEIGKRRKTFCMSALESRDSVSSLASTRIRKSFRSRLSKILELFRKVKKGQLYSSWKRTGKEVAGLGNPAIYKDRVFNLGGMNRGLYNYTTYNKDNFRVWNQGLQRQQKTYYFQKNVTLPKTHLNSQHNNNNKRFYWSDQF